LDEGARFLVSGAHALALHGVPRATGDLAIWIERDPANSERVWRAIISFGAPVESLGVSVDDLGEPRIVVQLGLAPRRIDLLTDLTGLEFEDAWTDRLVRSVEGMEVPFLGRRSLIQNKRATGRLKDLADLEALDE
jgi:hypothetical protein